MTLVSSAKLGVGGSDKEFVNTVYNKSAELAACFNVFRSEKKNELDKVNVFQLSVFY
jgi:hypothetical protein